MGSAKESQAVGPPGGESESQWEPFWRHPRLPTQFRSRQLFRDGGNKQKLDKSPSAIYTGVCALCFMAWLFFDNLRNGLVERWSIGPENPVAREFEPAAGCRYVSASKIKPN
jgi:hypothetical protein